jgi:hypothetical protein
MGYRKTMACPHGRQAMKYYSILILLFTFVACTNTKKATYFSEKRFFSCANRTQTGHSTQ